MAPPGRRFLTGSSRSAPLAGRGSGPHVHRLVRTGPLAAWDAGASRRSGEDPRALARRRLRSRRLLPFRGLRPAVSPPPVVIGTGTSTPLLRLGCSRRQPSAPASGAAWSRPGPPAGRAGGAGRPPVCSRSGASPPPAPRRTRERYYGLRTHNTTTTAASTTTARSLRRAAHNSPVICLDSFHQAASPPGSGHRRQRDNPRSPAAHRVARASWHHLARVACHPGFACCRPRNRAVRKPSRKRKPSWTRRSTPAACHPSGLADHAARPTYSVLENPPRTEPSNPPGPCLTTCGNRSW